MYKTVLFDLDGTLLNTIDDLADSANRVCAAHGWPQYETAQYRYFVGNGIPKLVERFSPASCRSPEQLTATLAEFDKVYGAHMHDKTAPYPGMPALLARLKAAGVRMAVFSNKADEFARAVVARYFDADLFEVVRGALPDVPTKPAPEGTRALMAHLGVEADGSVLYVGDSNVDVETAHNAGLPCCGVLWGFRTREELTEAGAEYLAEDTQGLEKVVLGREGPGHQKRLECREIARRRDLTGPFRGDPDVRVAEVYGPYVGRPAHRPPRTSAIAGKFAVRRPTYKPQKGRQRFPVGADSISARGVPADGRFRQAAGRACPAPTGLQ